MRLLLVLGLAGCVDGAGTAMVAKGPTETVLPTANPPVANAHDTILEAAVARQLGPRFLQSHNLVIDRVILVEGEWREDNLRRTRAVALQTHDAQGACVNVYVRISQFGDSAVIETVGQPVTQDCR
jgi:hypothetical protein